MNEQKRNLFINTLTKAFKSSISGLSMNYWLI